MLSLRWSDCMKPKLSSIRFISILSLDVVLGAVVGTLFVADFLSVNVPLLQVIALAVCVWLIYTADHLLDAYQLKQPAHTPRHRFHQRYFRTIGGAFVVVALLGVVLLFFLPLPMVWHGTWLVGLVALYFLLSKAVQINQYFPKELMTALLYAAGIFLSPLVAYRAEISWVIAMLFLQYVLLALANLLIFSWFEVEIDEKDQAVSFAKTAGRTTTRQLILLLLGMLSISCCLFLGLFSWGSRMFAAEGLVLGMSLLLLLIMLRPGYFAQHERYRLLGDGIFLLPTLILLTSNNGSLF